MMKLFTKKLSEPDINEKRLAIPKSSCRAFKLNGAFSNGVEAEDRDGRIWQFYLTTPSSTEGTYSEPLISRGWPQFVKCKELRVGDRVALYRDEYEAQVPYKIEVERKACRLFGEDEYMGQNLALK